MEATTLILLGPTSVTTADLVPREELTIGREEKSAGLVLRDRQVSRVHLEVRCGTGGGVELVDLGSHNGTLLDGSPLVPHEPRELAKSAIATLGAHYLWRASSGARWMDHRVFVRELERPGRNIRIFTVEGHANTSTETVAGEVGKHSSELHVVKAVRDLVLGLPPDASVTRQANGSLVFAVRDADVALLTNMLPAFEALGLTLCEVPRDVPAPRSAPENEVSRASAPEGMDLERIALSDITVLILGETGSGKEVTARYLHSLSKRAPGPFVVVNCAAIAESLFESELFGHERGAFTGANVARQGYLESANGGTILLDEVGELSNSMQAKLLRVLESRAVHRVGSVVSRPLNVRFMAATLRDLPAAVAAGTFRDDLYFRLCGVTLRAPPLRTRTEELPRLASDILRRIAPGMQLAPSALARLRAHPWPGNVRELKAVLERALLVQTSGTIEDAHLIFDNALPRTAAPTSEPSPTSTRSDVIVTDGADRAVDTRRERVQEALTKSAGNQRRAAELLGISRRTLTNWLNELDFPRPRKP